METERFVSVNEMKEELRKNIAKFSAVKITKANGQVLDVYIRGFADQQSNVLLFSETFGSLGLKIVEVKDICTIAFQDATTGSGSVRTLKAKWNKKLLITLAALFFMV
jgi:hypothetical protein